MKYLAFLRGINVGGKNIIKKEQLNQLFQQAGGNDIKTYLQSGNVSFYSDLSVSELNKNIDASMHQTFGYSVPVFVIPAEELQTSIQSIQFNTDQDCKYYISFLFNDLKDLALPLAIENTTFLHSENSLLFSVGYPVKGRYGFPNQIIEKDFKVTSTTRTLNTVLKMLK